MYLSPWKFFRNQILLDYSGRWRNQSCQIFFQSVHPCDSGKGSNFTIFSANRRWPLQLLYYRTTVIYYTASNQGSIKNSICPIVSKEDLLGMSMAYGDGIHSLLIPESHNFYQNIPFQSSNSTSSRYYYANKHMSNWLSRFRCWRSIRAPPWCATGVFFSVAYKFCTRRRVSVRLWLTRADKPGLTDNGRGGKARHYGKTR